MGKTVKERIYDLLPEGIRDKIATEDEVADLNDLPAWLEKVQHPIIETEEYKDAISEDDEDEGDWEEEGAVVPMGTVGMTIPGVGGGGGFKLILKNCKIHAESIIIKRITPQRRKKQIF